MSEEQNITSEMINKGMEELNNIAQTNASSSEETSASAEELNNLSVELLDAVSFFKV